MSIVSQFEVGKYSTRLHLGMAVAMDVSERIKQLLSQKEYVSIAFASAPSQNEFLDALRDDETIPWDRLICFHLDEYIGLESDNPQSFSYYLQDRLFQYRKPKQFHMILGTSPPTEECARYARLLRNNPLDIACIGIGENGHIAFNDPQVADFQDPDVIKVVELDQRSRIQQVNDGCFETLDEVPTHALSLTIPTILSAPYIYCSVPGERKKNAVYRTLYGPIDVDCPASILRQSNYCKMYLDHDSYSSFTKSSTS